MTRASLEITRTVAELVLHNPPLNLVDLAMGRRARASPGRRSRESPRTQMPRARSSRRGRVFCAGVDVHPFLGHDRESSTRLIAEGRLTRHHP